MHSNNSSTAVSTSHYQVLSISLMSSLVLIITVGNVLSLTIFLGSRRFHTPQGYLKVSLASADLAVGVVVVPYSLFHEINSLWTSQRGPSSVSGQTNISDEVSALEGGFQPCFVMGPVFAGCTLVSITTIFLLSLERGITILKPLQKNVIVTKQRTLGLIAMTWLLCSVIAVSPLLMSKDVTLAFSSCSKMCNYVSCSAQQGLLCPPDNNTSFSSSVSMAMLVFPVFDLAMMAATCVVNAVTFSAVRRFCRGHSRPAVVRRKWFTKASSSMKVSTSGPSFSDIRAAKTIAVLTALFCASLLPVAVLVLGNVLLGRRWCRFSLYAFWSLACSSGWNVLVYSTCDRRFRQRTGELLLSHPKNTSHV
ncbi:adenosine receptor A2b-like [Engraulis encrasicolus]|uniref:adenosine receptor A2b-like n=1 Tax=Engraulis encrasicolus TaxID=184585 RepID=UPI002FD74DB9